MIRTRTAITTALALAGAAHAEEDRVVVHTAGLSAHAAHVQLYKAARTVCAAQDGANAVASTCTEAAYVDALHQLSAAAPAEQTAALARR